VSRRTRRKFVRDSAALTAAVAAVSAGNASAGDLPAVRFASQWDQTPDRIWIGPEFWTNPLQDWRLADGWLECIKAAPERHVHLLTHAIASGDGDFSTSVVVGRPKGDLSGKPGSAGFRIGITAPLPDYRHALIFGRGLDADITGSGKLFIGSPDAGDAVDVSLAISQVLLTLDARTTGNETQLALSAIDLVSGKLLGKVQQMVPAERVAGQFSLVVNRGTAGGPRQQKADPGIGAGLFRFRDWQASGSLLEHHPERCFGPILFSQYTLSRGVLKLSAQMPPLGEQDSQVVRLEFERDGAWQPVGEASIDRDARTATFRIEHWQSNADLPYRLRYDLRAREDNDATHEWTGTIRRDPANERVLTVADVSCNGHMAFPNAEYVENMRRLDPDLLAFTGDQFYESSGGYGVQRAPVEMAIVDMLRKWYLHGWTWRELMRDRPSISIPDDHDVYQGNIWGEGGEPRRSTQEAGGYDMPPEWVNAVHRTQTSHHPDPFDPAPGKRGISVYYGPLVYGGVSFAVLADRQFKSGPEGKVPPTGSRGDHVVDPNYDPKSADLPGLELLGGRQMEFLREWATDWRGARMKAVISQMVFTAMATTHGPNHEVLRADYDANGWPQTARNDALRLMRKTFAFHVAGDQHLPAIIRYGIDEHGDAGAALAGPAVNSIYPRWWEPQGAMIVRADAKTPGAGDFIDHFGHPLTVLAVANPTPAFSGTLLEAERDKACGLSLVRFDKDALAVTIECWPLLVDPTAANTQFPGWPVVIEPIADSSRLARGWLPTLKIKGALHPLVQVFDEANELVYNLRLAGDEFRPQVFAAGRYRVRVADPESDREKLLPDLVASAETGDSIEVLL